MACPCSRPDQQAGRSCEFSARNDWSMWPSPKVLLIDIFLWMNFSEKSIQTNLPPQTLKSSVTSMVLFSNDLIIFVDWLMMRSAHLSLWEKVWSIWKERIWPWNKKSSYTIKREGKLFITNFYIERGDWTCTLISIWLMWKSKILSGSGALWLVRACPPLTWDLITRIFRKLSVVNRYTV